jgi:ABC-2 type transport system ATP-binding protein
MENIIEVTNITKQFKSITAVNNVSFNVKKGEIFGFLGPNGAGKTTTIKMLTTLLNPTNGTIIVNGFNAVTNQHDTRKSFGIVFQDPSLEDELTAYENMQFHAVLYSVPKEQRQKRIKDLLTFVELWERKDSLVKTFSGGMKRRLEIARGLLHKPQIFFLDEPTLGLDPQTRNHIWGYIKNLSRTDGITIFFTTHYMEEAEAITDKIAIIDHGQIIAQGSPADLLKQTKTKSLEDAFLALTGTEIREENADDSQFMRRMRAKHCFVQKLLDTL